ncbi:hypothetical protein KKC1_17170, partial [Calderihabitans maritimus]
MLNTHSSNFKIVGYLIPAGKIPYYFGLLRRFYIFVG